MTKQTILVRREKETGKVISQELLFDSENTEHIFIDELPEIEERDGYIGRYVVSDEGIVSVIYEEIPKTEIELLREQLLEQEELLADLMLQIVGDNSAR